MDLSSADYLFKMKLKVKCKVNVKIMFKVKAWTYQQRRLSGESRLCGTRVESAGFGLVNGHILGVATVLLVWGAGLGVELGSG